MVNKYQIVIKTPKISLPVQFDEIVRKTLQSEIKNCTKLAIVKRSLNLYTHNSWKNNEENTVEIEMNLSKDMLTSERSVNLQIMVDEVTTIA